MSADDAPLSAAAESTGTVDGRRARRERGRSAVIEATLDLAYEGHTPPGVELIAKRSGVSVASIFRYFDTLDDLRTAVLQRYFEKYASLLEVPQSGIGSREVRIKHFVEARDELYAVTAPLAGFVRARAARVALLDDTLHRHRAARAEQVKHHFNEELIRFRSARRRELIGAICTLTSFESWSELSDDHGLNSGEIRRTWIRSLRRLLDDE